MVDADHHERPEHEVETVQVLVGAFGPAALDSAPDPLAAYRSLPEPVDPAQMVAVSETEPPPDPAMGRDSDHEYMLRYI